MVMFRFVTHVRKNRLNRVCVSTAPKPAPITVPCKAHYRRRPGHTYRKTAQIVYVSRLNVKKRLICIIRITCTKQAGVYANSGDMLQKSMSNVEVRCCSGTTSDVYACQCSAPAMQPATSLPSCPSARRRHPPSSCAAVCPYFDTALATEGLKSKISL